MRIVDEVAWWLGTWEHAWLLHILIVIMLPIVMFSILT